MADPERPRLADVTAIIRPADDADLQGVLRLYGELNPDDSALPEPRAQEVWAAIS